MKAYLVTFTATTRVVLKDDENPNDNPELFKKAVTTAAEKIDNFGIYEYLCDENAEIEEDTECPAGTLFTDADKAV